MKPADHAVVDVRADLGTRDFEGHDICTRTQASQRSEQARKFEHQLRQEKPADRHDGWTH